MWRHAGIPRTARTSPQQGVSILKRRRVSYSPFFVRGNIAESESIQLSFERDCGRRHGAALIQYPCVLVIADKTVAILFLLCTDLHFKGDMLPAQNRMITQGNKEYGGSTNCVVYDGIAFNHQRMCVTAGAIFFKLPAKERERRTNVCKDLRRCTQNIFVFSNRLCMSYFSFLLLVL